MDECAVSRTGRHRWRPTKKWDSEKLFRACRYCDVVQFIKPNFETGKIETLLQTRKTIVDNVESQPNQAESANNDDK